MFFCVMVQMNNEWLRELPSFMPDRAAAATTATTPNQHDIPVQIKSDARTSGSLGTTRLTAAQQLPCLLLASDVYLSHASNPNTLDAILMHSQIVASSYHRGKTNTNTFRH
jgi:hypothetical protein